MRKGLARKRFESESDLWRIPRREAARLLGVKERTVRKWCAAMGLSTWSDKQARLAQAKLNLLADPDAQPPTAKASLAEFARRHHMAPSTVDSTLKAAGVAPKCVPKRPASIEAIAHEKMLSWGRPEGMEDHIRELRSD